MRHLFEEYGDAILQGLGGLGVLLLMYDLIRTNGYLHNLIVQVIEKAC